MITSMTGFGRRQGTWLDGTVTVEVRSVNHRFLEIGIRLPKTMGYLEEIFKKAVQSHCRRGRVDLSVLLQGGQGGSRTLQLDVALAKQYHRSLRALQRTLKLGGSIDIGLVAGFRDIIALSDQPVDDPKVAKLVERLGVQALRDLVGMRKKEGALLAQDILGRLTTLWALKGQVAERAPAIAQETFGRMKLRVEKLLGTEIPDMPRLHQELAFYADRCDITEELVRLDAHMVQFQQTVRAIDPAGKTLDFLLQEMGREVNTIGSKANDSTITAVVVQMKAELERIREQVQNVE
ncbi:MAG TPA: YicC/YloC family endoribonuclease [Nitrospira sp.]|nr:YicC/YloC family endoribonuclease [Nitrospira sp.]